MLVKGSKGAWALVAWLLFASCNPEQVAEVEPDEYEIYSVAISALYGSSAADHFVLLTDTVDDPTCNFRDLSES